MTINATEPRDLDKLEGEATLAEHSLRFRGDEPTADLVRDLVQALRDIHLNSAGVKTYFYVSGRGPFPFDMLRYDQCWPVSDGGAFLDQGQRRIRIGRVQGRGPTEARWSSFGWSVEPGWDN